MSPLLLVPGPVRSVARAAKLKLYGVAFLVVIALLLGLSIAIYQKALPWQSTVPITLKASSVGNQLSPPADVKLRGIIVGTVRSITSNGDVATLDIALDPDKVDQRIIPANVRAMFLPKTLFGEKFVDLVIPQDQPRGAARPIQAGDVITEDRTSTAIETEQVFDNLLPLLRALHPEQLNATLGAIATALEGQGQTLGQNFELIDRYFSQLNPVLPQIKANIRGLADLAETYDGAANDLLALFRNSAIIGNNLVSEQQQLQTFLTGTTSFANITRDFLAQNEQGFIQLASISRPTLEVLAKYAPEYPCLLGGLARQEPLIETTLGGNQPGLRITLEVVKQRQAYGPGDGPQYKDVRGPRCYGLPNDPIPFNSELDVKDGFQDGQGPQDLNGSRRDTSSQPGSPQALGQPGASSDQNAVASGALGVGLVGSDAEKKVVAALLAPRMGGRVDRVPDVADLLFGPLVRGTAVSTS